MSGSIGAGGAPLYVLPQYGIGFQSPFSVFVPTFWNPAAQGNVPNAPIDQTALASQSAALQSFVNNSLGTVANLGAWEFGGAASLLSGWADNLGQVNMISANALKEAVAKSAKGCSGFLSCVFG